MITCSLKSYWVRFHTIRIRVDYCIKEVDRICEIFVMKDGSTVTYIERKNLPHIFERHHLMLFMDISIYENGSKSLFELIYSYLTACVRILIGLLLLIL